jgi:hypothetical protein
MDNREEMLKLGRGYHYGEFWGKGIQREDMDWKKKDFLYLTLVGG